MSNLLDLIAADMNIAPEFRRVLAERKPSAGMQFVVCPACDAKPINDHWCPLCEGDGAIEVEL